MELITVELMTNGRNADFSRYSSGVQWTSLEVLLVMAGALIAWVPIIYGKVFLD